MQPMVIANQRKKCNNIFVVYVLNGALVILILKVEKKSFGPIRREHMFVFVPFS